LSVPVPTPPTDAASDQTPPSPECFVQLVDDVITFADPALASEVASRVIWAALSASWNG
jgi:hypothetical protein